MRVIQLTTKKRLAVKARQEFNDLKNDDMSFKTIFRILN